MTDGVEVYYPLAVGYCWTYQSKDGSFYTNAITAVNPANANEFTMVNSLMNKNQIFRKDAANYVTDSFEEGTLNVLLKDNATLGETWDIKFKANGLDSILVMTVKELNGNRSVNGKDFENVMMIEAESKILVNGNLMPLNYFTQYYYAKGTGLILTTTSMGDEHKLTDRQL